MTGTEIGAVTVVTTEVSTATGTVDGATVAVRTGAGRTTDENVVGGVPGRRPAEGSGRGRLTAAGETGTEAQTGGFLFLLPCVGCWQEDKYLIFKSKERWYRHVRCTRISNYEGSLITSGLGWLYHLGLWSHLEDYSRPEKSPSPTRGGPSRGL